MYNLFKKKCPFFAERKKKKKKHIVGYGFECFYCYVNKLKSNGPNKINLVENGLKNWALVRIATTEHVHK